jgi:Trypsin-like peptidase domain
MQFITDLALAVILAYLSFTTYLGDQILALFPEHVEPAELGDTSKMAAVPEETGIVSIPSLFGNRSIPDILRRSIEFQSAAALDAQKTSTYTDDPLAALVNIYCTFTTPELIRTTTGTGFFVHSDGVIMTNAHVAQFLLLGSTDLLGDARCVIRHGEPATDAYEAELLYIPPAWVQENAAVIDSAVPTGTGERDYALLYVTDSLTESPLPNRFPALAVDSELLALSIRGTNVIATGYPATDLIKNGGSTPLIPKSAVTTISELYTFGSNYADVIAISGSSVGAEGSSGGPVVDSTGKAIGMIVTRGDDAADGKGSLRAITLSHIARTIEEETGFSFERNISGNLPKRSEVFMETLAPFLLTILETELKN